MHSGPRRDMLCTKTNLQWPFANNGGFGPSSLGTQGARAPHSYDVDLHQVGYNLLRTDTCYQPLRLASSLWTPSSMTKLGSAACLIAQSMYVSTKYGVCAAYDVRSRRRATLKDISMSRNALRSHLATVSTSLSTQSTQTKHNIHPLSHPISTNHTHPTPKHTITNPNNQHVWQLFRRHLWHLRGR